MGLDSSAAPLEQAVGAANGFKLLVSGREIEEPRLVECSQAFAVVGRAGRATVPLASSKVSFRHAYLQMIDGKLFCADLGSETGIFWGTDRRASGWLWPGHSVRIGPYTLQLVGDPPAAARSTADDASPNPLEKSSASTGSFPQYTLELFDDCHPDVVRSIDRRITLFGRHPDCSMRLDDESVSAFHCALVLTQDGLWVVDLLGKNGTRLDDKAVSFERVEVGSVLSVGTHSMSAWRRQANEPLPDADVAAPPESQAATPVPRESDWLGTLFSIAWEQETLIIAPTISRGILRDAKLQTEANALRRKLVDGAVCRLVIDLHALEYRGAEVIRVVVMLARQVENAGGLAALCCAGPELKEAVTNKGLDRIWPLYSTRDEALAAVSTDG
jgi:anti-anti-sigma factor